MVIEEPLTQQDVDDIKANLAKIDNAEKIMDRARRGGIDISGFQERSRLGRDQLVKLLQAFAPGE